MFDVHDAPCSTGAIPPQRGDGRFQRRARGVAGRLGTRGPGGPALKGVPGQRIGVMWREPRRARAQRSRGA
ncbi:hypothetical protein, partial [Haematobacter missouriensis]